MKTLTADVVVIGSGPSGLSAAAQASEDGAKVVVFEKANVSGGAANMGMGPLGIGTKHQQDMMVDIDVKSAFKEFMEYTHWRSDARMVKKYFENSADTIKWLEESCGVEFAGAYKYFPKSHETWHIVAVNGGIGRNGGAIMNKHIREYAEENGTEFLMETPAKKIVKSDDGKICAVIGTDASGEEVRCDCKAVVIATGGCGDNPQMIKERTGYEFQKNMFNFAIPGLKGDGIKMAAEAGAGTTPMNVEMMYILPNSDAGPDCIPAVFMQPNLLVNKLGQRFIDEEQMQNTTFTGNAISFQKDAIAFSIIDSKIAKYYMKKGVDVVNFVHHPDDVADFAEAVDNSIANDNPDVVKADTIEELAEKLGVDAEALQDTIDEYNDMCETGDNLFYKPSKYMRPIEKAPFYAAKFRPGAYGTLGGIKINEDAQVLTQEWEKVPGLFAAGTDTCTIYGDSYMFLMPGNTMGYCINTGRFAGSSAAEYAQED
ncbi:MAG: FAD-dependent oxidoreductase [Lachnospiraceae bacterium]|nr:FAD-dependent oxidoreductase [Lachnospiraceae bacterium]